MHQLIRRLRDDEGITLVELLVTLVILGVVSGITAAAMVRGLQTSTTVQNRIDTTISLQEAQTAITRQLRSACPVTAIGPYSVEVKVNRAGQVERHRFSIATGSTDLREAVAVWNPGTSTWTPRRDRVIASGIRNNVDGQPAFAALTRAGTAAASPSATKAFRVDLRRRVGQDTVQLATTISLRNGDLPCPNTTP
jgi:prepilin-type N-terminal cleavage/methylation domain-containing protein